jgi:hypothetical protein
MNANIRAFLYGTLILVAALIPPMVSLVDLIRKFGSL